MIKNKYLYGLGFWLLLVTTTPACSYSSDPNNQLIMGPFDVNSQWRTITFDKPLKTSPYVQTFGVLLDFDQYKLIDIDERNINYGFSAGRFKRLSDSVIVEPEVILINSQDRYFKAYYHSIGTAFTDKGDFKSIGFGTNSHLWHFYFPKNVVFKAVMIRANVPMEVKAFRWISMHYFQAPNRKWSQVVPSEIVDLDEFDYCKQLKPWLYRPLSDGCWH